MTTKTFSGRREFLRGASALTALGLGARLNVLDVIPAAGAQAITDYKALVCVFLFGGNDGNNTLIPFDTTDPANLVVLARREVGLVSGLSSGKNYPRFERRILQGCLLLIHYNYSVNT